MPCIALLYLVLCIIAIRPILCDNIPIPLELMLKREKKVHHKGRRPFIEKWCQQSGFIPIKCVKNEIRHVTRPLSFGRLNWAMMGVDETGEGTIRIMEGCHRSRRKKLMNPKNLKEQGINEANYRLTESDTKNYELCRSDCILDKVYTKPEEWPQ
jgi:hypothetical protein